MNTAVSDFRLKHEKYSTRRSNSGTRLAYFLGFSLVAILQRYPGKLLSVKFVVHQREMAVGNTMWVWIQASLDGADGQEMSLATGTRVENSFVPPYTPPCHGTCS